jgi:hypothetical protein
LCMTIFLQGDLILPGRLNDKIRTPICRCYTVIHTLLAGDFCAHNLFSSWQPSSLVECYAIHQTYVHSYTQMVHKSDIYRTIFFHLGHIVFRVLYEYRYMYIY